CNSVKITNLKAPDVVVINENNQEPIVLDCEYEIGPNEKGFVLKWLLDGSPIYQWIPSRAPFALRSFKDRVNVSYEASTERNYKHRALAITRPLWNFTGEYLCNVQTYESNDKRSRKIQFIQPETKFDVSFDNVDDEVAIMRCSAHGIAPKPNVTLYVDSIKQTDVTENTEQTDDNLFDVVVHTKIFRSVLKEGSSIHCELTIPGTNYVQTKDISYSRLIRPSSTTTTTTTSTQKTDVEEKISTISQFADREKLRNEDSSSTKLSTPATIMISIVMFLISKL
ncbi:uncharacterized protein LOC134836610, partial [Culicoides brevitarsis]